MTTFDMIMLKCPHCGMLMSSFELMSYTVYKSVSWSDGKTDQGAPEMPQVCVCLSCKKVFWKGDARMSIDEGHEPQDGIPDVMDIHDLDWRFDDDRDIKTIGFYKELLDSGFTNTDEKEFYVRTRLWWAINDLIRYNASITEARNLGMISAILNHRRKCRKLFRSYHKIQEENLTTLLGIYAGGPDVDLLYLANMYREAGMFSQASETLDKIDRKSRIWRKLRSRIRKHNSRVFEL